MSLTVIQQIADRLQFDLSGARKRVAVIKPLTHSQSTQALKILSSVLGVVPLDVGMAIFWAFPPSQQPAFSHQWTQQVFKRLPKYAPHEDELETLKRIGAITQATQTPLTPMLLKSMAKKLFDMLPSSKAETYVNNQPELVALSVSPILVWLKQMREQQTFGSEQQQKKTLYFLEKINSLVDCLPPSEKNDLFEVLAAPVFTSVSNFEGQRLCALAQNARLIENITSTHVAVAKRKL